MSRTPIPITSRRLKLLSVLHRVNRQLRAWDNLDALAQIPATQRVLHRLGSALAASVARFVGLPLASVGVSVGVVARRWPSW